MRKPLPVLLLLCCFSAAAQKPCGPTPVWSPCEIELEMAENSVRQHPNPYLTVDVWAELRSPEYRTYRMPAYWDGGRRLVIRFAPTQPGEWTYRISGNLPEFDEKTGRVTATASEDPGFIRPANVHHWIYPETLKPHLYMGDTNYSFAYVPRPVFDSYLAARAAQKFTHVRGLVMADWHEQKAFATPDKPNPEFFRELDARVRAMNQRGLIADLILAGDKNAFVKNFPEPAQRERYLKYLVARYAPMNITWQLAQEFEEYDDARAVMRDLGSRLRALDPYNHPRTAHAVTTSSPLLGDGWQDHILYQSSVDAVGAIEHQIFPFPQVNAEFGYENSGAGATHAHHVDFDTFRKRLWNATMNGQYPVYGNTGTYGGRQFGVRPEFLEAKGAKAMTTWAEVMGRARYWELEPYFDAERCRVVALPDVEYLAYIENPSGPIEITVEKHEYQVYWINPATGETIKEKKDWKGEVFTGTPPSLEHDWVLHLSRDGRKEGMARSYKFESRRNLMQEIESDPRLIPYDLTSPKTSETLEAGAAIPFTIKLRKTSPGTRRMTYLIVGEVVRDAQGARVLGHGMEGQLTVPPQLLKQPKGVVNMRVFGLNAPGKLYSLDLVFPVSRKAE